MTPEQQRLRAAIVLAIDAWSANGVPAASITSRRLADMLETAVAPFVQPPTVDLEGLIAQVEQHCDGFTMVEVTFNASGDYTGCLLRMDPQGEYLRRDDVVAHRLCSFTPRRSASTDAHARGAAPCAGHHPVDLRNA